MSGGTPNTRKIEIPLDGGMDQRQHPRQVQAPLVKAAANVRWSNIGAADKRAGVSLVGSQFFDKGATSNMVAGQGALMALNDELIVTDGYTAGTYSDAGGVNRFIAKGKVPEAVSTTRPVGTTQYFVSQPDIAYMPATGLLFHVWGANDRSSASDAIPRYDIYWCVEDASTGAEVVSSTSSNLGDYWLPRLAVAGTNAIMVYEESALPPIGTGPVNIDYRLWDPVSLTWGAPGILVNDARGTGHAVCSDGTNYFMVYETFGQTLKVVRINPSSAVVTASIVGTETIPPTFLIGFSILAVPGERVWVSYVKVSGTPTVTIRSCAFANDLSSQTIAPWSVHSEGSGDMGHTSMARLSSTTVCLVANIGVNSFGATSDGRGQYMIAPVINASGAIVGNASGANRKTFWAVPCSNAFVASATPLRCYVWAMVGGAQLRTKNSSPPLPLATQPRQWTMTLLDLRADDTASTTIMVRPITWQDARTALVDAPPIVAAGNNFATFYNPCSVVSTSAIDWSTDYVVREDAATRVGMHMTTATFGGPNRFVQTSLSDTLYMTPGWFWDRRGFSEIGFCYWPQTVDFSTTGSGGGLSNGKQYAYRVVYEDVDGTGAVHRSQPSDPIFVTTPGTTGATSKVTLTIPTLTVTARQGPLSQDIPQGVRIVVYRAGPLDIDPVTYYRVFSDNLTPKNQPLQGTITVDDVYYDYGSTVSMAVTVQPDTLYTLGGILPNVQPPGFTCMTTYHNRLWGSNGDTLYFSKFFVDNEAISFTDAFTIPLEDSAPITALWVMDDSLCIATDRRIYRIQGNGPSDANTDNDLSAPQRVATDLGVVDQRSVVVTPVGTMYQSPSGLTILDRSFSVPSEPLGARVRADLAAFPEVTSALVHPSGRYITFTARNPTFTTVYAGVRLVYDYATDRWSRDTFLTDNMVSGMGLIDEVVSNGRVYSLTVGSGVNSVYVEDFTTNLDNGQWVTMGVEIAEIHPLGLQGYIALRDWAFSLQKHTDHDVRVLWFKDYEPTNFALKQYTLLAADSTQPGFTERDVAIHKSRSMRIQMFDVMPTSGSVTTGQGSTWINVAVDFDPLDNKTYRLPAAQKG